MKEYQEVLSGFLKDIQLNGKLNRLAYQKGKELFELGHASLLLSTHDQHRYIVIDDYQDFEVSLLFVNNKLEYTCSCRSGELCSHAYASLLQSSQDRSRSEQVDRENAIKYSREGMVQRVMQERLLRSKEENYEIDFSDNIYGEHILYTESKKSYTLSFYHFDKKIGYCSCPDYQTNKLGTCKHLMFAFDAFENTHKAQSNLQQAYPFIEIFRNPLHDYQLSWFFPHQLPQDIQLLLSVYFDNNQLFKVEKMDDMHLFLSRIKDFKNVNIRPEVGAFVESYYEEKSIKELFLSPSLDKKLFPNNLYDFQWEGIAFAASRKGSILAHEIGLGKTVQALGAAIYKMHVFDFKKTTILCPKNLKQHWVLELHKWVSQDKHHLFEIESFERMELKSDTDFLIIDEAQKIDDYDSVLLQQLHQLNYKHILMITDSKIHRSLMKFYAMAGLIDQHLLTPLWEFSYKHCLFDAKNEQEIVGYYNLENLPNKLSDIYLRREKAELKEQIVSSFAQKQIVISVALSQELLQQQSKYSQQCVAILQKKQANHYDYLQLKERLQEIVDLGLYTADSSNTKLKNPKLEEFQHFIKHKLLCRSSDKIIVFAQGTALQKQLKRILNEDYKKVQILKSKEKANPEFEVFIVEELLQDDLPTAQHYIYFHVPREPHFISQRSTKLKGELMDTSMYLLQSSPSFEEVLLKWEKNHNSLLNQLAEFLGSNNSFSKEISLRLKEELSHQLKALVVAQKEEQMSLFEDIMKPKIAVKKEKDRLQLFVEKWKESLLAFEQLSSAQQHLIRDGKLRVRESEKELLFAFLKR